VIRSQHATAQPLLILHDIDYLNDSAHPFVERLSRRWQWFAVAPGFGGSNLPADFDSVDDLAYVYLDLLRQIGQLTCLVWASRLDRRRACHPLHP